MVHWAASVHNDLLFFGNAAATPRKFKHHALGRFARQITDHTVFGGMKSNEFGFTQPWHVQWQQARGSVHGDPAHRWLFVLEDALGPCVVRDKGFEIGKSNRRTWWLVPGTAVRPDCVTPPFANDEGDT